MLTNAKLEKLEFEDMFESQILKRYNKLFTPKVKNIRAVIKKYNEMAPEVSIALFSTMVDGKLVHDLDEIIGRKPYKFISYSKRHFIEVTIPKYSFKQWTKEGLEDLSKYANKFFVEYVNLPEPELNRSQLIKDIMSKFGVFEQNLHPKVPYNMLRYTLNKMLAKKADPNKESSSD